MISVYTVVQTAFDVMWWLIIARVLISWVPHNPHNSIFRFIYEITEPIMAPFRRLIPTSASLPIDFSPIIALFALRLLENLILRLI